VIKVYAAKCRIFFWTGDDEESVLILFLMCNCGDGSVGATKGGTILSNVLMEIFRTVASAHGLLFVLTLLCIYKALCVFVCSLNSGTGRAIVSKFSG